MSLPRFAVSTRLLALTAAVLLPAVATAQANLALGKPAFASSVYDANRSTADKAVDGTTQGNYFFGSSIFHSANPGGDYWYVDLGATYDIGSIVFWNRTDCCSNRIIGSTLGIFADQPFMKGSAAPVQSFLFTSDETMQTFTPDAGSARGRYVGIQNPNQYLQIAELEVYAPSSTVPEPGTWALLGTGLIGLGATARRRRTVTTA